MAGRPWTPEEVSTLRDLHRVEKAGEIARRIGRTTRAVYQAVEANGLEPQRRTKVDEALLDSIRKLNAEEWPDHEIASHLGAERHTVSKHRKVMGLPSHKKGRRWRERITYASAVQCRKAGVDSLGAFRSQVFRQRSATAGWPADLRPRHIEILEALAKGAMTRRELAGSIGMPWKGSRQSLRSNDPEGSYLAHLIARGLVVSLGRVVRGSGKGRSTQLYSLSLPAEASPR